MTKRIGVVTHDTNAYEQERNLKNRSHTIGYR
jgi:hypothetical protein